MLRTTLRNAIMPSPHPPAAFEPPPRTSPQLIQFEMVQGPGYRCVAYCDENGQWQNAHNNEELFGNIQILG